MSHCTVCGNRYDKMMIIELEGTRRAFDCFECAINALAPSCARCGVRILGHGLEADQRFYCCAHCARGQGVAALKDRAD
ncbi:MAG: hypothetical protein JNG84_05085, partial [Archangium sp.]|nr:hypothetical protein [Archangium sp.]